MPCPPCRHQDIRRNRGALGCDGQTLTDFDRQRDHNLYRIWNRLCSGSYFLPPEREKRIPKDNGKERILGIPTVSDRGAQGAVKRYVKAVIDPIFHPDSYGTDPPWLTSYYKADIHFDNLHNLRAWYDRVKVRPAVQKALREEGLV